MSPRRSQLIRLLAGAAVLGLLSGGTWALLTPTPQARILADGSAVVAGAQVGRYFDAVGVFAMVMLVLGVVVAAGAWWGARAWRGPDGALLAVGSAVVSGAVAMALGTWVLDLRLPDLDDVHIGETFGVAPDLWMGGSTPGVVTAPGLLLVIAPFVTAFCYLCVVLVSGTADLGRTGPAEPTAGSSHDSSSSHGSGPVHHV